MPTPLSKKLTERLPAPWSHLRGRRCPEPGCITILNGYNPGPHCLRHTVHEQTPDELDAMLDADAAREAPARRSVEARA